MIHFVGAGSGAPDLITLRGKTFLEQADVIIYAGSLVNPQLLDYAKEGCQIYNSAKMTLEEVLDAVKASGIQVNIELKTGIYWYPEIEQKVADLVKASGMEDKVIYSSFNHYSIQQIKKIVPDAETAYLYSDVILNVEDYAENTGVDGLHPAVYHVKMADFLKEYLDSGLNVRVWTVNEKEDMEWLIRAGVTAIITNYPDKAVQIKEKLEA